MDYKELSRNLISTEAYWQVNKAIAKITDNDTAILLADLISKEKYFENKGQMNGDYFFNTVENIEQDTNIKKYKQRMCLIKLENLGIVETKMITIPRKRHYKINHEKLFLALSEANKIYSERKNRPLMSDNNNDCKTENTTTINKNKFNKNKSNNNKDITSVLKKTPSKQSKYLNTTDFINDFSHIKENLKRQILVAYYNSFVEVHKTQHFKLTAEEIEETTTKLDEFYRLTNQLNVEDYTQVDLINKYINYFFNNGKTHSIHRFFNHSTILYVLVQLNILNTEGFEVDGTIKTNYSDDIA